MDTNALVASLLRDLANAQTVRQKQWAYRRAADTILALDGPLESYLRSDGTLRKIPNVGPSSERVILDVLRTGTSAAAAAVAQTTAQVLTTGDDGDTFLSGARVAELLANRALTGPTLEDYRGDLQMHSTWSDGTVSVADMARACRARGYEFCAITDHSYGLPVAHGVSMQDLARQHREIDALNRRYRGRFHVLKGIEANILADGRLDMTADEITQVELVVASPHSGLRSNLDQTTRLLKAVSTPGVHILGHPRGRKVGVRPGIRANWQKVFARAARTGVAIEIDGDPRRQDIDFALAQDALAAGCFFALDSDAHAPAELGFVECAIAHARLASLPISRIVNCWPLDRLREWMQLRSTMTDP